MFDLANLAAQIQNIVNVLKDFSSCDHKVHRDNSTRRQYLAMVAVWWL